MRTVLFIAFACIATFGVLIGAALTILKAVIRQPDFWERLFGKR